MKHQTVTEQQKSDRIYHIACSRAPGIGPQTFKKIKSEFASLKSFFTAPKDVLKNTLPPQYYAQFISFREKFKPHSFQNSLIKKCIQNTIASDPNWPKKLSFISDTPIALFYKTSSKEITKNDPITLTQHFPIIAIVGTRKPTSYGTSITQNIIAALAPYDPCIISGMALGIDGTAHRAALKHNLKTIAVLGSAIDVPSPPHHRALYNKIVKKGLVLSEYPPGTASSRGQFVLRNRIVAALADAVIVIEGSKKSGTRITARYAAEYDRPVFAVPGPITSSQSQAPNMLIQSGAHPYLSHTDIAQELNLTALQTKPSKAHEIEHILSSPKSVEHIAHKLDIPISKTLTILTDLEIKGKVTRNPDATYSVIM